jgi:hypothetical protein
MNYIIIKSFCGGARGAVFSKSAPLGAGGIEENKNFYGRNHYGFMLKSKYG